MRTKLCLLLVTLCFGTTSHAQDRFGAENGRLVQRAGRSVWQGVQAEITFPFAVGAAYSINADTDSDIELALISGQRAHIFKRVQTQSVLLIAQSAACADQLRLVGLQQCLARYQKPAVGVGENFIRAGGALFDNTMEQRAAMVQKERAEGSAGGSAITLLGAEEYQLKLFPMAGQPPLLGVLRGDAFALLDTGLGWADVSKTRIAAYDPRAGYRPSFDQDELLLADGSRLRWNGQQFLAQPHAAAASAEPKATLLSPSELAGLGPEVERLVQQAHRMDDVAVALDPKQSFRAPTGQRVLPWRMQYRRQPDCAGMPGTHPLCGPHWKSVYECGLTLAASNIPDSAPAALNASLAWQAGFTRVQQNANPQCAGSIAVSFSDINLDRQRDALVLFPGKGKIPSSAYVLITNADAQLTLDTGRSEVLNQALQRNLALRSLKQVLLLLQ
jgi:hypothetical protein